MRILLVDDDPMVLRTLSRVLRLHAVTTAQSGEDALAIVCSGAGFDAVLCDLNMPGMGGRALHAAVDALLPELARRMIFMSGGASSALDCAFLTAHRRLSKPFAPIDLYAVLESTQSCAIRNS